MYNENNSPLVSVIIPFYKRYEFIPRAINSVISQTYKNIEILLINDGSPESENEDKLLSIINSFDKNIHYFKLQKNMGPSTARNYGIENSKGKYIAFLDSDDMWEKDKLFVQIKLMENNAWEFSHTSYWRHNTDNEKTTNIQSGKGINKFPFIAFHCSIVTPSVVIRSDILKENQFKPELRIGEDVLLWMEISKKVKIYGINKPLTHVYVGHQDHIKDRKIKEYGLYIIGREAFSNHPLLYFFHMTYRNIRVLFNKLIAIKFLL